MNGITDTIANNVGTWIAATIVGLLTVFSDKIIGRIRLSLNRADLRAKYFEELAVNLSTYVFWADIYHERHQKGWTDNREDLDAIGGEVNGAVTTLCQKEYVYRSWVRKYWGADAATQFSDVLHSVKSVDSAIHEFNDKGREKEKTAALGAALDTLHRRVEEWLSRADA